MRTLFVTLLVAALPCAAIPLVGAAPGVSVAHAQDVDPDVEVARRRFEDGRRYYEKSDYRKALVEFEAARIIKPAPAFDYNVARCHERLEEYPQAIAEYEKFQAEAPDPKDQAMARERVTVLKARMAAIEAVRAAAITGPVQPNKTVESNSPARVAGTASETTAAPSRNPLAWYVLPAAVGAVAVAVLATGAGLYGATEPEFGKLQATTCGMARNCPPSQWQGLQARERAGVGLMIAGGAVAAADVVLWVIQARAHKKEKAAPTMTPHVQLSIGQAFSGVMASGEF